MTSIKRSKVKRSQITKLSVGIKFQIAQSFSVSRDLKIIATGFQLKKKII